MESFRQLPPKNQLIRNHLKAEEAFTDLRVNLVEQPTPQSTVVGKEGATPRAARESELLVWNRFSALK